jgi:hypothetical protein
MEGWERSPHKRSDFYSVNIRKKLKISEFLKVDFEKKEVVFYGK